MFIGMRMQKAKAPLLALLAIEPFRVLADNTVSPPNPIGEKLYHAYLMDHVLPMVIGICTVVLAVLVAACVIHHAQHRAKKLDADGAGSCHC